MLIDQLRTFQKHLAGFEKQIARVFAAHPDALIFKNLPGAGPALAPRLLVAFGSDRTRYPEAASLQKYGGLAPVREKSGGRLWTHWRWQAPTFLRQTFVEWAGQTILWSAWAKTYYQRMKAKDKSHQAILRALAFKWIRVLWKCWRDRVIYDEAHYLRQLRQRQSPNALAPAT
jgi:transposase